MESRDMENELQSLATDIEDLKTTAGRILLKLESLTGKVDDLSRYVGSVIRRLDERDGIVAQPDLRVVGDCKCGE